MVRVRPEMRPDVTRTVVLGTPTAAQRDRFTRVLKGHLALAMARFPAGTNGSQLDTLAREPLWQAVNEDLSFLPSRRRAQETH